MKRQILLNEYEFSDGVLIAGFTFDGKDYIEDYISEDIFESYIVESGRLEFFEDKWLYDVAESTHATASNIVAMIESHRAKLLGPCGATAPALDHLSWEVLASQYAAAFESLS